MRLQCTIAAAVLALTVGAANASTFNVDGSFASCTSSFYPTLQSVIAHTPIVSVCAPISLSGSLTINGGVLTALDLTTTQSDHFSALFLSQISNVNGNNWHLQTSWNAGG